MGWRAARGLHHTPCSNLRRRGRRWAHHARNGGRQSRTSRVTSQTSQEIAPRPIGRGKPPICRWHGPPRATSFEDLPPLTLAEAPMVDKLKKLWLDGQFVDWDDAKVHILTHTLHYGLGVFDGMRAYKRADGGTYVFRLREHVDRLFDGCKMCLLQPKFTREQVANECLETLRGNGLVDGYIRPMVFIGEGAM